jgi:hypothetical protein
MRNGAVAALLVVAILAGAGAGYLMKASNSRPSTVSLISTVSNTVTVSFTTRIAPVLNSEVFLTQVNGSFYWADDVSKDTEIGMPGYSYFRNASITFGGVKFQTICPPIYSECPIPAGTTITQETVLAGAISFNMTFPDGSTETAGDVIGNSIYLAILSQHQPRAGMLIEYVNDYPNSPVPYAVFLLVSACCAPPYLK